MRGAPPDPVQAVDARGSERSLVVFMLEEQRYALDLHRVRRALRLVAVTPLPGAPPVVSGIVDLGGEVLPVIDLRHRFGHPPRAPRLSDHLVVASTGRRVVALHVDEAGGVLAVPRASVALGDEIRLRLELVEGAVRLPDGLVLIHDLERLLSLEEDAALARAMSAAEPAP
ncbi:MAG: chemotaxis protein CheW [Pseudomonadota bacterium]